MLRELFFLQYGYGAQYALTQSLREGKCVEHFRKRAMDIDALPLSDPSRAKLMYKFWDELESIPTDYYNKNPSDYDKIIALTNKQPFIPTIKLDNDIIYDKVLGGWLGRIIGCMFGKPVEGYSREVILNILHTTDNFPMRDYFRVQDEKMRQKVNIDKNTLIQYYDYAVADDDTNYTVLGLALLEKCGKNFSSDDVAEMWITNLPAISCCTAEFCAYRNFLNKIFPPQSAFYHNPFKEWIGAQIRGDIYGYVSPLDPVSAAKMACRDACISHAANGIYGEMFVSAMIASAFDNISTEQVVLSGLSQIPVNSTLYHDVMLLLDNFHNGKTLDDFIEHLHSIYHEGDLSDTVHTISNALIVVACMLYSDDIVSAMGNAVMCGFDTDCNGATVGSILGVLYGAKQIPNYVVEPLHNTLQTDVKGFYMSKITDLAQRTIALIDKS